MEEGNGRSGSFPVLRAERLAEHIVALDVKAPFVARAAKPGQFVMLRIDERGERIPLTIAKSDAESGTVTVIFLEVGKTTYKLGRASAGDVLLDFVGPLGKPSEIERFGKVVCVGGGIGVPELYPTVTALAEEGNEVVVIVGARSAPLLVITDWLKPVCDELIITTDDGSAGRKGLVTEPLEELVETGEVARVLAVGPVPMMRAVAEVTRAKGVPTIVSLNAVMVDGTGMCGVCRVSVGGATRYACVDGPEFDAHEVDFDLLVSRQRMYLKEEALSLKAFLESTR